MADRAPDPLDVQRFWAKVEKTETCWLWTAYTQNGYGRFWVGNKMRKAHRVAYEMSVGMIPEGLTLDHLCRVRNCVNPAHLEPVTAKENTLRGDAVGAINSAKTHCKQGHPFEGENLYIGPDGKRKCRSCGRAKAERYRQRKGNR